MREKCLADHAASGGTAGRNLRCIRWEVREAMGSGDGAAGEDRGLLRADSSPSHAQPLAESSQAACRRADLLYSLAAQQHPRYYSRLIGNGLKKSNPKANQTKMFSKEPVLLRVVLQGKAFFSCEGRLKQASRCSCKQAMKS